MDFFLDTGPIFGFVYSKDRAHHKDCINFFHIYPVELHNYYTMKKLIEIELKNVSDKRIGLPQVRRIIVNRAIEFLSNINEADYSTHMLYGNLTDELQLLLENKKKDNNSKDRDAKILASAFLWDFTIKELYNPAFLTTDGTDIRNNRDDIAKIAHNSLNSFPKLAISTIREITRSRGNFE